MSTMSGVTRVVGRGEGVCGAAHGVVRVGEHPQRARAGKVALLCRWPTLPSRQSVLPGVEEGHALFDGPTGCNQVSEEEQGLPQRVITTHQQGGVPLSLGQVEKLFRELSRFVQLTAHEMKNLPSAQHQGQVGAVLKPLA